jgi:flagellar motility protein MotE (MotC chaperone)
METLSSAYFVGNFFAITLPILVSVWLGNRQTQKIIRNTNEQTQRVIQEIVQNTSKQTQRVIREIVENTNSQTLKVLNEIKELQQDMKCLLEKTHALQKDTLCVLRKLDFGFKANALMHGWRRADGISPEEAAKLPEPKIYDATLRVCYYKAD